jgi:pimeloyl-ACP methyl ester carboxylesterase
MGLTRRVFIGAGAAALVGAGYAGAAYRSTRAAAFARIAQRSSTVATQSGKLEYAIAGRGAPLMMIHGTGGGFDQGLRFGQGLVERGLSVIAPSRFGYLGSDFPEDASAAAQADALVELLDHLGIDRLPVAGGSAGALPAAQFALRHPDRCSHLILLVPAMNLTDRDPVEFTWLQRQLVGRVLTSDFWFWALMAAAPDQLTGTLLATDPALLAQVSAAERERARLILGELMPISRRVRGMQNDGRMAGQPARIDLGRIAPPVLVISAQDDRFGTAATARTIKERLPGARLVIYPSGGHIWLGHDADLSGEIAGFVQS